MPWWNFPDPDPEALEADDALGFEDDVDRVTDSVLALLARLARTEATVTMVSMSNPASMPVQFVRTQGNRLTLRLLDPSPQTLPVFGPLSCVLLIHVTGSHAELVVGSVIREPTEFRGQLLMMVEAGRQRMRADARRSYRVPVTEESGLRAVVRTATNERYAIAPHDISQGGLGGELIQCPNDALRLGSTVQVAMRCGAERVCLDAQVRFRRGSMIGVFFPEVWRRTELEAPPELRSIVKKVERAWIRQRRSELDD